MIRSDGTAPHACPVATRVDAFANADDLWASYRTTCVAANGAPRCAVLADWGFSPNPPQLGVRTALQWNGLPCGITRDANLRCYADQRKNELASFSHIDQAVVTGHGTELCVLSRTAVSCMQDKTATVLASNVAQIAADERLWALRKDGTVVRLDLCPDGDTWNRCSVPVDGMRDIVAISSGGSTVCGLAGDGHIKCAQCVAKTACTDPAKIVDGIADATQVVVGIGHACAVRKAGEVVCWGSSSCGESGGDVEAGKVCPEKPIVLAPTTIVWAK